MILDVLQNLPRYADNNRLLLSAYDFIQAYKKHPLACGRYEIDGDRCFAFVQSYETVSADKDYEMHERYMDLQYVVAGTEKMFWTSMNGLHCTAPPDTQKDIAFYTEKDGAAPCELSVHADEFVIFYPQEPHKPGCFVAAPETVRKIVVKIRKD